MGSNLFPCSLQSIKRKKESEKIPAQHIIGDTD
jgi:hypothetical protein